MSQTFKRIIKIISSPGNMRNSLDIESVLPWLKKQSTLLAHLDDDVLVALVKKCKYRRYKKDDLILHQGDYGNCFYIMLSGKTSVYIDPLKTGEEQEPIPDSKVDDQSQQEIEEITSELNVLDKRAMDRNKYGKHVGTYDAGKSFGEIALISKDSVRNATIIADEDTDTMAIDKDTYGDTLKATQEEESQEQSTFVNSCPLFQNWNHKFKRLLEMSIKKVVHPFGSPIAKQGDPFEGLYFIVKGEAKISVDPSTHKTQYPKLFDPSNTVLAKELGKSFVKKQEKKKESLQQEQIRVRRMNGYVAAEKRLAQKVTTLCVVDANEIIGDVEFALGLDTYAQTIVCTANTQLFLLDNKTIERFITKKYTNAVDIIREKVLLKLKSRQKSKLGGCGIELYQRMIETLEELKPKRLIENELLTERAKQVTTQDVETVSKSHNLNQLLELYLDNKAQLIDPYVPGTVYYKTKSVQKARRHMMDRLRKYESTREVTPQVRLERARKAARRQPRSRRELERLTIAQDPEEASRLYDRNHAVNRFLSKISSTSNATSTTANGVNVPRIRRPHTATGGSSINNAGIFKFTEPQISDEYSIHDVDYSDLHEDDIRKIVRDMDEFHDSKTNSRARVISSMMDQNASINQTTSLIGYRPKSAPTGRISSSGYMGRNVSNEEYEETFDYETSHVVLSSLEDKIKAFHSRYECEGNRKGASQVKQLKRFNITKPDDVPIPGGTVFVRQRECKFPPANNNTQHQHIRRFIIPKDAASIASTALSTMDNSQNINNSSNKPRIHNRRAVNVNDRPDNYNDSREFKNNAHSNMKIRPSSVSAESLRHRCKSATRKSSLQEYGN